jgi:predicted kinase
MKAFVMVGAPGAGKSTLATQIEKAENAVVISGDEIRAELYGNAAIQGKWEEIHDRIEEMVSESCGMPVVLDGTHYLTSYRREALALLRSYGYDDVEAIVVNPPLEDCIFRNANRHRGVPRHVVIGMHEKLQKSLKQINTEGFTRISYYENY